MNITPDRYANALNRIDTRLVIFILLCINYLGFSLHDNEEQYFTLARQYFDPQWIPGSFSLTEFPGTRLLYQVIVGYLLDFLSFEQLAFWGRLFCFIGFAFPLAMLFRWMEITNLEAVFLLHLFYLSNQTFFAKEFIFGTFETKTLAYIFVFYAVYYLFTGAYQKSVLFVAAATYFHVLIGGWFFVISIGYLLLNRLPFKQLVQYGFAYGLLALPFVLYLAQEIILNSRTVINGVNTNWVYVYVRAAHHVGILKSIPYFIHKHLFGVGLSLSFFLACLYVFRRLSSQSDTIEKINTLLIVIFSISLFSVLVAYWDRNGAYLKYYPFRKNALAMFFSVMLLAVVFKKTIMKKEMLGTVNALLFFILLPFIAQSLIQMTYRVVSPFYGQEKPTPLDNLSSYIKQHTQPRDVFMLIHNEGWYGEVMFFRKARRDLFFSSKLIPSGGEKIYDWYVRLLETKRLEQDVGYIKELQQRYDIDYVVSATAIGQPGATLQLIYNNEQFWLYRVLESTN